MAEVGFGTKLEYKQGAGAWTELSEVLEINGLSTKVKAAEYMPIKASSAYMRRLPATAMVDPMTFKIVWTSAIHTTLKGFVRDSTLQWRITFPNGTNTDTVSGFLTSFGVPIQTDEVITIDIEITPDNSVAYA